MIVNRIMNIKDKSKLGWREQLCEKINIVVKEIVIIWRKSDSFNPHNLLMLNNDFDDEVNFFVNAISTINSLFIWYFMKKDKVFNVFMDAFILPKNWPIYANLSTPFWWNNTKFSFQFICFYLTIFNKFYKQYRQQGFIYFRPFLFIIFLPAIYKFYSR